ncbi:universal stress protein [Kiloniella sp.]|uniref:universal stress protein n=1 Tax=Kiloniella sp. TaxID=1938587 RepID=UPI003B0224FF
MLRDIQVLIDEEPTNKIRIDAALQLSKKWEKVHIIGVHALKTPEVIFYGTPYDVMGYFPQEIIELKRAEADNQAKRLKNNFEDLFSLHSKTCEWRQQEGRVNDILSFNARFTDLTIISQPSDNLVNEREFSDSLIMEHGLSILAVPEEKIPDNMTDNILIAWNGSPESARAVKNALPLLEVSQKVVLLSVGKLERNAISAKEMQEHLLRHDINCIQRHEEGSSPENTILSVAHNENIGLIIAGAWGHSRIREIVFGGVTKRLFTNQKIPVFLSH